MIEFFVKVATVLPKCDLAYKYAALVSVGSRKVSKVKYTKLRHLR